MSQRLFSSVIVYSLAAFLLFTNFLLAQSPTKPTLGLKAGLNYSTLVGENVGDNVSFATGFRVGGFISIPVGEKTAIVPEVFYSRKGAKSEIGDYSETLSLNYIEIPVTLSTLVPISRDIRFRFFTGPEMMLKLSATAVAESNGNEIEGDVPNIKSVAFGILLGVGFDFRVSSSNWLLVDVRGDVGLTSIHKKNDVKDFSPALCVGLSF